MTEIPSITFREFIRKIKDLGFEPVRQKGSHIRFLHPDGRKTTVPDHGSKNVSKGLLNIIIRHDIQLDIESFFSREMDK